MRLAVHRLGDAAGEPVVLLHGLFGQARNFAGVQRALAAEHAVLAIDLRNHGLSPHHPGMHYAALATDVAETLAAEAAAPAAVIGHSMGGKVAMRLALDHPSCVSRLLVADIAPRRYRGPFAQYAAAMQAFELHPDLTRAHADAQLAATVPEPGVRGFLLQNLLPGPQPRWRFGLDHIAAGMEDMLDWPNTHAPCNRPALFVAGDRSDYIRPQDHAAIRSLFPKALFATVHEAGHWLHADNPAGFLSVVQGFLEG